MASRDSDKGGWRREGRFEQRKDLKRKRDTYMSDNLALNYVLTHEAPQSYLCADVLESHTSRKALVSSMNAVIRADPLPSFRLHHPLLSPQPLPHLGEFDVIMITPPWSSEVCTMDALEQLPLRAHNPNTPTFTLAASAVVFIWCGSDPDSGRTLLDKWNLKRLEDVVWAQTGQTRVSGVTTHGLLRRSKEHCAVGFRKSKAPDAFTHNVDTDIILAPAPPAGEKHCWPKPAAIFEIAERLATGRRRLHLFASDRDSRKGWVSVGPGITSSNFDLKEYRQYFRESTQTDYSNTRVPILLQHHAKK